MKKSRIIASVILTAGLSLSGMTAASANTGTTAPDTQGKGEKVCVIHIEDGHGDAKTQPRKTGTEVVGGGRTSDGGAITSCPALPTLPGHGKGKVRCIIVHVHGGKGDVIIKCTKVPGKHGDGPVTGGEAGGKAGGAVSGTTGGAHRSA